MAEHVALWHYLTAPFVFALLGAIWHMARGLWAPWPERMTDSNVANLMMGRATGFRFSDIVHDTEFDEDGFYRWDSGHNLKVAIGLTVVPSMILILCSTEAALLYATAANWVVQALWDLFLLRIEQAFGS